MDCPARGNINEGKISVHPLKGYRHKCSVWGKTFSETGGTAFDIKEWERAEIERSAAEASHTKSSLFYRGESDIARYINPPSDTCFPREYAFHVLGDVGGKSVLDLGCGSGECTLLLARLKGDVYAMDISESLIQVAKQRLQMNGLYEGVKFLVGSAHNIPLPDESIDVVFGMSILHHVELSLAAGEIWRVLRKGGRAIFHEPVRNSEFFKRVRGLIPYKSRFVSLFERPLTDQELRAFAYRFTGFRSRAFRLPHINIVRVLPGVRRLINPMYHLDRAILRRFPGLCYYATVAVVDMVKS